MGDLTDFDYSAAMAELREIADKVENPNTSLDDIGALVKRSRELIRNCRNYLRSVREEIESDPDAEGEGPDDDLPGGIEF